MESCSTTRPSIFWPGSRKFPRIARNIRTGDQRFHILTTPRVAQAVVSPALSLLRKSNDRLSCSIDLRARFELDSAIASTRFDLVLASLPLSPSHVPIDTKPLFKVRIEAVVPNDHNFAKRGSLTADDLAGETLIGPWRNPAWRQQMGDALPAIDFSPSYALETHSSLMAYQMASDGAGIAFFDRLSARGLNTEAVKFLPLSTREMDHVRLHSPGGKAALGECAEFH